MWLRLASTPRTPAAHQRDNRLLGFEQMPWDRCPPRRLLAYFVMVAVASGDPVLTVLTGWIFVSCTNCCRSASE